MPRPETIFALATPSHPSPVALARVSGPLVAAITRTLCGVELRRASLECQLDLPVGAVPAAAWLLPGPRTLTGDDVLELRVPGNPAIVRQLEQRLRDLGARDAEPGEFTRRALDAGKLDLSRAEAVLRLVSATDDAARRQAVADLSGRTAEQLAALTERLRAISARFELSFDFSEEEHAEALENRLIADLREFTTTLRGLLGAEAMAPRQQRPVIALFGPPNAGKSTLFNALLGKPRALVSEVAGTTRDPVEAELALGSHRVLLQDLSGVGSSDIDLGRFAETARARALQADLLLLLDAPGQHELPAEFKELQRRDPSVRSRVLWVYSKADIAPPRGDNPGLEAVAVSAGSGGGLAELHGRLVERLDQLASGGATSLLRMRCGEALKLLEQSLADAATPLEVTAGDVRRALKLLDEAQLAEAPGEVLDLIFSRFCIGK